MVLGNRPRRLTNFFLDEHRSYTLLLRFIDEEGNAYDLTDCIVRIVVEQPQHYGGQAVVTMNAAIEDAPSGVSQFDFQASDLSQAPGEYPYDITLVNAAGYSTAILKGVFDIGSNVDPDTSNVFSDVDPFQEHVVTMGNQNVVDVELRYVDSVPGEPGPPGDPGEPGGMFIQPEEPGPEDIAPYQPLWVDTDADDPALATYLALDGSNAMAADIDAGSNNLVNVANPVAPQDGATRAWTEAEDAAHSTLDRAYTDGEVASASSADRTYADTQDDAHSTADRNYTDTVAAGKADAGHGHTVSDISDAGTSAVRNVAASGDASATEVVKGDDSRLTDARTPSAHSHTESDISDLQAYLTDAPSDGSEYLRKDGGWVVPTGGGGDVEEAPVDGTGYVRKDGAWAAESGGGGDVEEAPVDGTGYVRKDGAWAAESGGGASAIDDLTDVDTSTTPPNSSQGLVWDGTNWIPGSVQLKNDVTVVASGAGVSEQTLGNDRIITFQEPGGTLTVTGGAIQARVLMVAGGGSGGKARGGGGGAGGLIHHDSFLIPAGAHTITVGAGGVGTAAQGAEPGADTTAFGLTAIGGGNGGSQSDPDNNADIDGGSGGGGNGGFSVSSPGGLGTPGQGYDGASGSHPENEGGGGGGAGGTGQTGAEGADGGPGLQFDISGPSVFYAGGGGGGGRAGTHGDGGSGIGGNGSGANGGNAVANTGSGGGGADDPSHDPGDGSGGIVIVRFTPAGDPVVGATALDELSDVDTTSAVAGDTLVFSSIPSAGTTYSYQGSPGNDGIIDGLGGDAAQGVTLNATQSSTYGAGLEADNAFNPSTALTDGRTHTLQENNPWWMMETLGGAVITVEQLGLRTQSGADSLHGGLPIIVEGRAPGTSDWTEIGQITSDPGVDSWISNLVPSPPMVVDAIRIRKTVYDYLIIGSLEIWGTWHPDGMQDGWEAASGGASTSVPLMRTVGAESPGASTTTVTSHNAVLRKVSLEAGDVILAVEAYLSGASGQVGAWSGAVYTDNAGSPADHVSGTGQSDTRYLIAGSDTAMWRSLPLMAPYVVPATGDYWIGAFAAHGGDITLSYDTGVSGDGATISTTNNWIGSGNHYTPTINDTLYSFRAQVMKGVSAAATAAPGLIVAAVDSPQAWKDAASYVCTGANDDVEIQQALDDIIPADTSSGSNSAYDTQSTVVLAPGNFSVADPIVFKGRQAMHGSGRNGTFIKAAAGHSAIGSSTDGMITIIDELGTPYENNDLRDFTLYGSGLDLNGIYAYNDVGDAAKDDDNTAGSPDMHAILRDIVVAACGRSGVIIDYNSGVSGAASTSWRISDVRVWSCGDSGDYAGFYIEGTDIWVRDCEVGSQGVSGNTTSIGFHCKGSDNYYSGCIAWVTKGIGFLVEGAKQRLVACNAHHCMDSGFKVSGTGNRNQFIGCLSYNNANTGFIIDSVNTVVFSGCQAFDDGDSFSVTGRPMSYGFQTTNTFNNSAGLVITDCITFGSGLVPLDGVAHDDQGAHLISISHTGNNQNGAGDVYTLKWQDGVASFVGDGTPEGKTSPFSTAAPVGSTYRRRDGGAGTTLYIKESGTGNTGWSGV